MPNDRLESLKRARVARIWQGRTTAARADEYEAYLYENGIRKIAATNGPSTTNHGRLIRSERNPNAGCAKDDDMEPTATSVPTSV